MYSMVQNKITNNMRQIKPYKSDKNVKDINPEIMCDDVNIWSPVIYFYIILKLGHKLYNRDTHEDIDMNSYWLCMWIFHDEVIFFT